MNQKMKGLGFEAVRSGKGSNYITINDLGVISFSGRLRRELNIKRTESCCIYFNEEEGVLGLHIGTFNRKKNKEYEGIALQINRADTTVRAREQLANIEDEYRGYRLIPSEGVSKKLEDVEVENVAEPPDPHSRMVLVTIKRDKVPFRGGK
tara:strand:+ start:129 stop:581 length:453 start_codon:yes stop_codon:yes gene_type:complete